MPARPVIDDIARLERAVEVHRQAQAEQQTQADGHVAVAGEVEVDLQRIAERTVPGVVERRHRAICGDCENRRGVFPQRVGKDHLLEQAEHEYRQPQRNIVDPWTEGSGVIELLEHFAVMGNGAGDQLRKEADEEAVIDEIVFLDFAVMGIHQIGDLLESEEGNGQRQNDVAYRPAEAKGTVECAE